MVGTSETKTTYVQNRNQSGIIYLQVIFLDRLKLFKFIIRERETVEGGGIKPDNHMSVSICDILRK